VEGLQGAIDKIRSGFTAGGPDLRLRSIRGMIVETARGEAMERLAAVSQARAAELAKLVFEEKMTVEAAAVKLAR
jgi:hypothetical protein